MNKSQAFKDFDRANATFWAARGAQMKSLLEDRMAASISAITYKNYLEKMPFSHVPAYETCLEEAHAIAKVARYSQASAGGAARKQSVLDQYILNCLASEPSISFKNLWVLLQKSKGDFVIEFDAATFSYRAADGLVHKASIDGLRSRLSRLKNLKY